MAAAVRTANRERAAYFLIGLIGVGVAVGMWRGGGDLGPIAKENGLLETLSALFYLVGGGCCLIAIRRRRFVPFSLLWIFLCVLFFGEETSWMQHYLHYTVESVERVNDQSEFNLHNLHVLHGERFVDGAGHIRWSLRSFTNPQTVFQIGSLVYFLLLPLIVQLSPAARRLSARFGYPAPSAEFVVAMFLSIGTSMALALVSDRPTRDVLAETREMFYAFFICLYAADFILSGEREVSNSLAASMASKSNT